METRAVRVLLRVAVGLTLLFLFVPLFIVILYAFNGSVGQKWPIDQYTVRWFGVAWRNGDVREALLNSVIIALTATGIALVLGTLSAFAVHRFRFFGREAISFALVLPIALPGIITGIALNSAVTAAGLPLSLRTIIIGHATCCVVLVYNNVIARLRRTPGSLVEASMDLGADGWQTFRYVTLPVLSVALVAGGLLAFALSFDEIIVTNLLAGSELTVPKWIFDNLRQPRNRPTVNVVAMALMLASLVPVFLAQRLTQEPTARTVERRPSALEPAP